ncbi:DUF6916 family protein [Acidisphaera sp. S103]|uniref:DUF6916 family protein n=1 Tax=Acidisphaera sp. S103 TaxID=1747223 RepID=UPI00131E610D|nr:hypothetical protein [Acidisphaera sp. S103]
MDEPLTHEHFSPHVGKRFSFEGHHLTLLLRLAELQPRFAAPNAPRVPFTLTFEGPAGDILPPDQYRAVVPDGPVFELYISPIHTPARDHQDYQAVFN